MIEKEAQQRCDIFRRQGFRSDWLKNPQNFDNVSFCVQWLSTSWTSSAVDWDLDRGNQLVILEEIHYGNREMLILKAVFGHLVFQSSDAINKTSYFSA